MRRVFNARFIIDTHVFIWFVNDDPQLSANALQCIKDPGNEILVSAASIWENSIKVGKGKLDLTQEVVPFYRTQMRLNKFRLLRIKTDHFLPLTTMPHHHGDPFDRLLIAQAMIEGIAIISADNAFDAYNITRLW